MMNNSPSSTNSFRQKLHKILSNAPNGFCIVCQSPLLYQIWSLYFNPILHLILQPCTSFSQCEILMASNDRATLYLPKFSLRCVFWLFIHERKVPEVTTNTYHLTIIYFCHLPQRSPFHHYSRGTHCTNTHIRLLITHNLHQDVANCTVIVMDCCLFQVIPVATGKLWGLTVATSVEQLDLNTALFSRRHHVVRFWIVLIAQSLKVWVGSFSVSLNFLQLIDRS